MDTLALNTRLSVLALELVKKCGGYTAAALECDISSSQLERAANPDHEYTLKASTIYHLEQACGEPIMSRGLLTMTTFPFTEKPLYPIFLGIDLAASATDLTVKMVDVMKDGKVSRREYKEITRSTVNIHAGATRINRACLSKIPNLSIGRECIK